MRNADANDFFPASGDIDAPAALTYPTNQLMNRTPPQHVTIIGVGLLGGSIGLALKTMYPEVHIAGVGRKLESLRKASKIGAIDSMHLDATQAVVDSDVVILATPVCAFEHYLTSIKDALKRSAWVTDVGSTKLAVVKAAKRIVGEDRFIGSHPMAGSEQRGPAHARADLFDGATCLLTPTSRTPERLLRQARRLWRMMGMKTIEMTPARHDRVVARVSHLPHLLAGALMLMASESEFPSAANGFADMTRLAGGDYEMWRDILLTNRTNIIAAIDAYEKHLQGIRQTIEDGRTDNIERMLKRSANRRRKFMSTRINR